MAIIDQQREVAVLDGVRVAVILALPSEATSAKVVICEDGEDINPANSAYQGLQYDIIEVPNIRDGTRTTVALVTLPRTGNNNAAICAALLKAECPNLEALVMCGVAGGLPSTQNDIRLGDVVVQATNSGLVQWDYGHEVPQSDGIKTGYVPYNNVCNRSPQFNLAINNLRGYELQTGRSLWRERLRQKQLASLSTAFKRPKVKDELYEYHSESHAYRLVNRAPRQSPNEPEMFEGVIASGNRVVRSADIRDELKRRFNAVAVEMEGAGVADLADQCNLQFVVVRGICDYCDVYKIKAWQPYAAAVAAAYVWAILSFYPTSSAAVIVAEQRRSSRTSLSESSDQSASAPMDPDAENEPLEYELVRRRVLEARERLQGYRDDHNWAAYHELAGEMDASSVAWRSTIPQELVTTLLYEIAQAYASLARSQAEEQTKTMAKQRALELLAEVRRMTDAS